MKRRITLAITMLAACAAAVTATAPAEAATNCRLTVVDVDGVPGNEVRALELNEKADEIFLKIDGAQFPADGDVAFTSAGQTKSPAPFGNPNRVFNAGEEIKMDVVERDPLFNDGMGLNRIPCAPLSSVLIFNDGGAGAYAVEVKVELI